MKTAIHSGLNQLMPSALMRQVQIPTRSSQSATATSLKHSKSSQLLNMTWQTWFDYSWCPIDDGWLIHEWCLLLTGLFFTTSRGCALSPNANASALPKNHMWIRAWWGSKLTPSDFLLSWWPCSLASQSQLPKLPSSSSGSLILIVTANQLSVQLALLLRLLMMLLTM